MNNINKIIPTTLAAVEINGDRGLEIGKLTVRYNGMVDIGVSLMNAVSQGNKAKTQILAGKIASFLESAEKSQLKSTDMYSAETEYFEKGELSNKSISNFASAVCNISRMQDFHAKLDAYMDFLLKTDRVGRYVSESVIDACKEAIVVYAPFYSVLNDPQNPLKTTLSSLVKVNIDGRLEVTGDMPEYKKKEELSKRIGSCMDKDRKAAALVGKKILQDAGFLTAEIKKAEIKASAQPAIVKVISSAVAAIIAERQLFRQREDDDTNLSAFVANKALKEKEAGLLEYARDTLLAYAESQGLTHNQIVEKFLRSTAKNGRISQTAPDTLGELFLEYLNSFESNNKRIKVELTDCILEVDEYPLKVTKATFKKGVAFGIARAEQKIDGVFELTKDQDTIEKVNEKYGVKIANCQNEDEAEIFKQKAIKMLSRARWIAVREVKAQSSGKLLFQSDGIGYLTDEIISKLRGLVGKRVTLTTYLKNNPKFSDCIICNGEVVGKVQNSPADTFYNGKSGIVSKVMESKHKGVPRIVFFLDEVTVENVSFDDIQISDYMELVNGRIRYKKDNNGNKDNNRGGISSVLLERLEEFDITPVTVPPVDSSVDLSVVVPPVDSSTDTDDDSFEVIETVEISPKPTWGQQDVQDDQDDDFDFLDSCYVD